MHNADACKALILLVISLNADLVMRFNSNPGPGHPEPGIAFVYQSIRLIGDSKVIIGSRDLTRAFLRTRAGCAVLFLQALYAWSRGWRANSLDLPSDGQTPRFLGRQQWHTVPSPQHCQIPCPLDRQALAAWTAWARAVGLTSSIDPMKIVFSVSVIAHPVELTMIRPSDPQHKASFRASLGGARRFPAHRSTASSRLQLIEFWSLVKAGGVRRPPSF